MKTTYATMHKTICLDKYTDSEDCPRPIKFGIQEVKNGFDRPSWGGKRCYTNVAEAIRELYKLFILEMNDHNYELRIPGAADPWPELVGWDNGKMVLQVNHWPDDIEAGWYDTQNNVSGPEYPLEYYPNDPEKWVEKGITSYSYDNYKVCIVTSNGDLVY